MADEEDPLGTASLRRTVAAARATAGAGGRLPPAPPPDAVSTPWGQAAAERNGTPPPLPPVVHRPRAAVEMEHARRPAKKVLAEPIPSTKQRDAWMIAHGLLQKYGQEIDGNLSKAELHLAQGLMQNGAMLLRYGLPMESLSSLIRLARDLAHNTESEAKENPMIEELRKNLERDEANIPVGEVINYSEGEEENEQ